PVVNALSHAPLLRRVAPWIAGLEQREVPVFAGETLQQWWARRGPCGDGQRGDVLLWPDTFTNHFTPHVGQAAVELLESAGWRVTLPAAELCCGLTWVSTGQLGVAKQVLQRTVAAVADHVRSGGYVVGLEPSCTAVFRSDAADLFPDDQDVQRLQDHTLTLAELLTEHSPGWQPERLGPGAHEALAQVHCHQHAVLGWDADAKLLADAGVEVEHLESGCCGLAGNFGFTAGHGDVSHALAERVMLPRVRSVDSDTVVLADGFSCRTQLHEFDSGGREGMHLAELLNDSANSPAPRSGSAPDVTRWRPRPPGPVARWAALAAVAAPMAGAAAVVVRRAARLCRPGPG
ncbi:MAG: (Fe-S)-binding protein, partial [Nocardioidaceae bacterium]